MGKHKMHIKVTMSRNPRQQRLIRKQVDQKLVDFKKLVGVGMPRAGWIRAIRSALGMNGRQYAERLGVSSSRVSALERDEIEGNATLKMMKKASEAMGCKFVYAIVPETSLDNMVTAQAFLVAQERLKRVGLTMTLEGQEVTLAEAEDALKDEIQHILNESPTLLWNQK